MIFKVVHFLEGPGVRSDTSKLENCGAPKCALKEMCANFYQLNEFVSSTLSGRAGRHMFFSQFSRSLSIPLRRTVCLSTKGRAAEADVVEAGEEL